MQCLDDDAVTLLLEGALTDEWRAAIEGHLDECADCRRVVAAAARAEGQWGAGGETESGVAEDDEPRLTASLARGTNVDRFVILGRVGAGGMGTVYAAYDPELDRKVALKFLHPHLGRLEERIRREAQAMARVRNPHTAMVYDVGKHDDRVFVAMEFVDGETLHQRLRGGTTPWREVVALFLDAGRGLEAAHAAGIVHRDFKPHNVLVGRDGRVVVTDFGLARAGPSFTATGDTPDSPRPPLDPAASLGGVGTPAYMAPEQFTGGAVDVRSDVFGFCVSLFEALHGALPFAGDRPAKIHAEILAGRVRVPSGSSVPGWLTRVVTRGLRAQPDERYPSMTALLVELARDPSRTRRRWLAVGFGGALVASLVALLVARPDPRRTCREGVHRVDEIRSEAQLRAIHDAFAATRDPDAEDAWRRVSTALDRFAGAWSTSYLVACEANRRPDTGADSYLRMACLSQQLAEAQAKCELFAHADAEVVSDATAMASTLGDPASCNRATGLDVAPSPSPALRPAVERVREQLVRSKSLDEAARLPEALATAQSALAAARAIQWSPIEAEAALALAQELRASGLHREAIDSATDAAFLAEGGRHDHVTAEAWLFLALAWSEEMARFDRAIECERHARAAIDRLGGDDTLEARLDYVAAARDQRSGRVGEGLAAIQRAAERYRRTGRSDRFYTWILNDLGNAQFSLGRYQEAADIYREAVALKEKVLGPHHPDVGITMGNLANALMELGALDEAQLELERAYDIFSRALHADDFLRCAADTNLGDLAFRRRDYPTALVWYQRALDISVKNGRTDHQVTREAVLGFGRTLTELGRTDEAIVRLSELVAREQTNTDIDRIDRADAQAALARALTAAHRDRVRALGLADSARAVFADSGPRGARRLRELDEWRATIK